MCACWRRMPRSHRSRSFGASPLVFLDFGMRQDQEALVGQAFDHDAGDVFGLEHAVVGRVRPVALDRVGGRQTEERGDVRCAPLAGTDNSPSRPCRRR